MKSVSIKTILWVSFFSIAMGFLETSVVVYLRALYYPEGFYFPMKIIASNIALTEVLREFATLIMLLSIGILAGRTKTEKFAYFIYSFAIWDIFYYIYLKILLNWPESLLTWDILFFIPTIWVGPVIAPVINSICMILLAVIIFYHTNINSIVINRIEWFMLILGSIVILVTYMMDYVTFIIEKFRLQEIFTFSNDKEFLSYTSTYIPRCFNWYIFWIGVSIQIVAIIHLAGRLRKEENQSIS